MKNVLQIGLVGDFDESVTAHRAIPIALEFAADALNVGINAKWLPTASISSVEQFSALDGLWCVPASPYRNMDGALLAIRYAREQEVPFLGTCGGFQHAVVEYARNVLGWEDADHAETAEAGARMVIAPLACSLVEAKGDLHLSGALARAYDHDFAVEGYRCSYGLNADFKNELFSGDLRVAATDAAGEVRALELVNHPFFVATLFQPERAALANICPPLVKAFVAVIMKARLG